MASEVVHRVFQYVGYSAVLAAVIAVVVWAETLTREHRASQRIESLEINISGGGTHSLADAESLERWIREHGVYTDSMTIAQLSIGELERTILSHSAVASANAHIDYSGRAVLDVELREPVARLRIDGYDMYITEDGFLLPTVEDRTVPVPVITGDYVPLFGPTYSGYARNVARDSIATLDRFIAELEDAKLPYYRALDDNDAELREALNESVRKGLFMSKDEYKVLVSDLERRKIAARERHSVEKRKIEGKIAHLTEQQHNARLKQSNVRNADADFEALIEFLTKIEQNAFWSAEIVQLMVTDSHSMLNSADSFNRMELSFVPRSGSFIVDLGTATELDSKLSNLYRFYNNGLDKIGWDKYSNISLRYHRQVICR